MVDLRCQVDALYDVVKNAGLISADEAAKQINEKPTKCVNWAKSLPEIFDVKYSVNLFSGPALSIKEHEPWQTIVILEDKTGKVIEEYIYDVDGVPTKAIILNPPSDIMRTYFLDIPKIGDGTQHLLKRVIRELAVNLSAKLEDVSDPVKAMTVREVFRSRAVEAIKKQLPVTDEQSIVLAGMALHRVYGIDEMELILGDDLIEEICVNSAGKPVVVYHRKFGWLKTNFIIPNEEDVFDYSARIGRRVGKDITNLNPMMDARLISGDRVMASMYPISMQGNTITIRKFARDPWTIVDFMHPSYGTISPEISAFLWMSIQYELSIMVAGGTASGKTSMLNSLCAFVPPGQRIISIEDTREIQLPSHLDLNWIQLTTRDKNPDGLGEVTMLDLIVSSLRMRPDRIIVGEIRDRDEAEVLFEAMHTGHSVYSTMHADTCQHVKRRVTEPPIGIPEAELEALQIIVTQYRDRMHGIRKTFEIAEVMPGTNERKLELNYLFRWRVKSDTFEKIDKSSRVFNDINMYTGMTISEMEEDLKEKQKILEWMVAKGIRNVNDVGRVMNLYYTDIDDLMKAVNKG